MCAIHPCGTLDRGHTNPDSPTGALAHWRTPPAPPAPPAHPHVAGWGRRGEIDSGCEERRQALTDARTVAGRGHVPVTPSPVAPPPVVPPPVPQSPSVAPPIVEPPSLPPPIVPRPVAPRPVAPPPLWLLSRRYPSRGDGCCSGGGLHERHIARNGQYVHTLRHVREKGSLNSPSASPDVVLPIESSLVERPPRPLPSVRTSTEKADTLRSMSSESRFHMWIHLYRPSPWQS